jgi:hypothetical protein
MSLLAVLAALNALGSVTDCSKGSSIFKLTSMELIPDPPIRGQNSTLSLSMNVPREVTSGTATYSVTYNYIPLAPVVEDLCTTLPDHCPIKVGQLNTYSSLPFDESLRGTINLKIEWKDTASLQLMCVSINTKI